MQHDVDRVVRETRERVNNHRRTQMESTEQIEKEQAKLQEAGDGKSHPESLSDPPKTVEEVVKFATSARPTIEEIEQAIDEGKKVTLGPDGVATIIAPLGYDVLEPRPEAIELCARIIHATVEAMNEAFNESTLDWATSGKSCIAGVERTLANPKETAEQNHEAWVKYKAAEGWVLGPVKDATLKTHPCMVPYSMLGPFAQSKDAVFHAIVRTMFGVK